MRGRPLVCGGRACGSGPRLACAQHVPHVHGLTRGDQPRWRGRCRRCLATGKPQTALAPRTRANTKPSPDTPGRPPSRNSPIAGLSALFVKGSNLTRREARVAAAPLKTTSAWAARSRVGFRGSGRWLHSQLGRRQPEGDRGGCRRRGGGRRHGRARSQASWRRRERSVSPTRSRSARRAAAARGRRARRLPTGAARSSERRRGCSEQHQTEFRGERPPEVRRVATVRDRAGVARRKPVLVRRQGPARSVGLADMADRPAAAGCHQREL